ncbi:MAG: EAL domain-containing protein [Betaproteobacteria bacterium]
MSTVSNSAVEAGPTRPSELLVPETEIAALIEHVQTGVGVVRHGRFLYVNLRLADMLGYAVDEMVANLEASAIVHPLDLRLVEERIRRRHRDGGNEAYDIRLLRKNGDVLDARVSGRNIVYGDAFADLVTLTDISEVKLALRNADRQARMLEQTEDLCSGGSAEIDLTGGLLRPSVGLCRLIGLAESTQPMSRRAALRHVVPGDRPGVVQAWREAVPGRPFELQHRITHAVDGARVVHHRGLLDEGVDGSARRGVVILQDITSQSDAEHRIERLANFDTLTGLPNRYQFLQRLHVAARAAQARGAEMVLLAIEVPQVRQVKRSLGFEAGDALALALAGRLTAAFSDGSQIARLSEGDFVVLVPDTRGQPADAVVGDCLRAVESALAAPEVLASTEVVLRHAVGVARFPADGDSAQGLLSTALAALRADGHHEDAPHGASTRFDAAEQRRIVLESALQHAIARDELSVVYQPQLELRSGKVRGVEALLRWNSATLGVVAPTEFIPVAERSGQILAIGEWVLRVACAQAAAAHRAGLVDLRVHVNISGVQLAQEDLAERIQAILLETGAQPRLLGVEVTETTLTVDAVLASRILQALRAIGVEIALDDFGTGYSNLSMLRSLPIDVIKIDRSYVHDVTASSAEVSMTRAVITMAHSLQMHVLAEGVETDSQLALLVANGCDLMQGYLFSKPVSPAAIEAMWLEGRRLPEKYFKRVERQRTLLLVDDEENILASLRRSLRRGGYRIITALSALEGLQRLAENEVDVIVSDQRMPGLTGVEFLRRAKELYPETIRMVLSGYTELQSITDAINEGAIYKFLTKPWEDDLLRANIDEAFRQKEMMDDNRRLDREVRTANLELADVNLRLQAALAAQNEKLSLVEDRGRSALDALFIVPVPLIGLDEDGLIAFANQDAEQLLPEIRALIGCYADESTSSAMRSILGLAAGDSLDVDVAGRRCHCVSRSVDSLGSSRGRIVALMLAASSG